MDYAGQFEGLFQQLAQPLGNDCVIVDQGTCADFMGTARTGNACNPFQDGPVDCCTDDAGALVCPAGM